MILCRCLNVRVFPRQSWKRVCAFTACLKLARVVITPCSMPLAQPARRSVRLPVRGGRWACRRCAPRPGAVLRCATAQALHCAGLRAATSICCSTTNPITRPCWLNSAMRRPWCLWRARRRFWKNHSWPWSAADALRGRGWTPPVRFRAPWRVPDLSSPAGWRWGLMAPRIRPRWTSAGKPSGCSAPVCKNFIHSATGPWLRP